MTRAAPALLLVLCASPLVAAAATIQAASGSSSDLQAACNRAAAHDTIVIPAGDFTLAAQVRCPAGVVLRGMGAQATTLRNGPLTGAMVYVECSGGLSLEVSDLRFVGSGNDGSRLDLALHLTGGCRDFRVHHCAFERFGGYGVYVAGNSRGVVDHCRFEDIRYALLALARARGRRRR